MTATRDCRRIPPAVLLLSVVATEPTGCGGSKSDVDSAIFPIAGYYTTYCEGIDRSATTCAAPDSGELGYGPSDYDFAYADESSAVLENISSAEFSLDVLVYPRDASDSPRFACTFTSSSSTDFTCGPLEHRSDACEPGDEAQVDCWTITATWTSAKKFEGAFHYFAHSATDDVAACVSDCVITWPFSAELYHPIDRKSQH